MDSRFAFIGVCLIILGLMLKLYTEMLKDSAFNARANKKLPEEKDD